MMFALSATAGCTMLRPEVIESEKGVLNTVPADLPLRKSSKATLLIFTPETTPAYDTVQMAYTVSPHQIGYFGRHEWVEAPGPMLHTLLTQTMERNHYYHAVMTPPYSGRYTYGLRTRILEVIQDFTSATATLRLSLHIEVEAGANSNILVSKEIRVTEPMEANTPQAGVIAANRAVGKALRGIVLVLLQQAP
jgi:cholesterol transport system auxiliary component